MTILCPPVNFWKKLFFSSTPSMRKVDYGGEKSGGGEKKIFLEKVVTNIVTSWSQEQSLRTMSKLVSSNYFYICQVKQTPKILIVLFQDWASPIICPEKNYEMYYRNTRVQLSKKFCTILDDFEVCITILHYFIGLYLATSGYLWLSWTISGYLGLSWTFLGHIGQHPAILGYHGRHYIWHHDIWHHYI